MVPVRVKDHVQGMVGRDSKELSPSSGDQVGCCRRHMSGVESLGRVLDVEGLPCFQDLQLLAMAALWHPARAVAVWRS